MPCEAEAQGGYMLVLREARQRFVFTVEGLGGVRRLPPGAVSRPPAAAEKTPGNAVVGVFEEQGEMAAVIDGAALARIFSEALKSHGRR